MRYALALQRAGSAIQIAWLCLELFATYHQLPVSRTATAAFALAVLGTPSTRQAGLLLWLPLVGPAVLLWFAEFTHPPPSAEKNAAASAPKTRKSSLPAHSGSAKASHSPTHL